MRSSHSGCWSLFDDAAAAAAHAAYDAAAAAAAACRILREMRTLVFGRG